MEDYFLMKKKLKASPLCVSASQGTATQLDDDSLYHPVSPPADEESGWTTYLDDFSKHQILSSQKKNNSSYCSSYATSSLLSDAASQYHHNPLGLAHKLSSSQNNKSSLIKKIRTNKINHQQEDPYEDTASSPNHSPKGNEGSPRHEMKRADGTVFNVDENHEFHNSLKEMGLCLVPLSLFSNYIG